MICVVDKFEENAINPITGREYDGSWIVIMVTHHPFKTGNASAEDGCAYTIRISRCADEYWYLAVGDAIDYCHKKQINAIVVISKSELRELEVLYENHRYDEKELRCNEGKVLVHSTTIEAWDNIQKDGCLKSWNQLKKEGVLVEEYPIGLELGDPKEFSDYIMFGGLGDSGEIVVSSKQCGLVNMNVQEKYKTGVRLYFDARKMAQDGLIVRDGVHIKVEKSLQLDKYLIWTATWKEAELESEWSTPYCFAKKANDKFMELHKEFA